MSRLEKIGRSLDKIIGVLSPEAANKRLRARVSNQAAARFYDGATGGRRADGWRPAAGTRVENLYDLKILRDRSRDFERNNGYYKKAVGGIVANTLGTGIVLQYKGETQKRRTDAANLRWKLWHDTTEIDFDGIHTGPGLQDLAFRTMVRDGEVFLRKRWVGYEEYLEAGKVPIKIQVLEAEYMDSSKDTWADGVTNRIVSGVEFDYLGRRVAYHMLRKHPSMGSAERESIRIPASEVIHLYRQDRPGQIRGVAWGASVFLNLKDLDGYEDAELLRRKIAACFAGFITEPEGEETQTVNGQAPAETIPLGERLEPGILEILPAGKSITFATPPNVTGYEEYARSILHKIASGFEVPYSVLTGDYSQTNFSSGRMGWLEFQRLIEQYRWNLFIPRGLEVIRGWFEDSLEMMGQSFEDLEHEWTAPRREMIDPLKEINAVALQVRSGFISMPEAIKEMGYDPGTIISETKAWNAEMDKAGITFDSDARKDPKRLQAEATVKVASMSKNSEE